jgi:hypothetical protein
MWNLLYGCYIDVNEDIKIYKFIMINTTSFLGLKRIIIGKQLKSAMKTDSTEQSSRLPYFFRNTYIGQFIDHRAYK